MMFLCTSHSSVAFRFVPFPLASRFYIILMLGLHSLCTCTLPPSPPKRFEAGIQHLDASPPLPKLPLPLLSLSRRI